MNDAVIKLCMADYTSRLGRASGLSLYGRIEGNISPEPMSGCWLWMGASDEKGYAHIGATLEDGGSIVIRVHRFMYIKKYGPLEAGMVVRHKCDVRCCVNPGHLISGTQLDNVNDMISRGRRRGGYGERHGNTSLTEEGVEAIRTLYECEFSLNKIARIFSIDPATVRRIVDRISWKHIA
jgi:hypothetical protein